MKVTIGVFITNLELVKDTLAAWLQDAEADGRMKTWTAKRAAEAFWAMMGGAFFWPALFSGPMKAREADAMKKELIQIFLARYKNKD